MAEFARQTVDLYSSLELDGEPCWTPVGSLEVAWTPERLLDLSPNPPIDGARTAEGGKGVTSAMMGA